MGEVKIVWWQLMIDSPSWLKVAEAELGVHEIPGPQSAKRILEYHQATSLKATDDAIPWCSSFANWVMNQAGYEGTDSAVAKSWLGWGSRLALKDPAFGCIVIMNRGNNSSQGHVGFFVGRNDDQTIRILGGNQADSVCIENFSTAKVIGYRWPSQ